MSALTIVRKFFPTVETVTDATSKCFIEVTKKDVESKAVKDHNACALAVACKRAMHLDGVIISRSTAYLIKGNKATRYKLHDSVSREIVSFDRGAGFDVGHYELAKISKSNRINSRAGRVQPDKRRLNKIKQFRHITRNARSELGAKKPKE